MRLKLIFFMTICLLMCGDLYQVSAKVPTTPKILFTSSRDGNYDVYIMNPDGSEQINLTQHRASDFVAVWSPTGDKIIFVSDRQGTRVSDLYVMDPDGANVRRVFKRKIAAKRTDPTWSPDGKQFAYRYTDSGHQKSGLYIATLGEEDVERISDDAVGPEWSPDGSEIACSVRGELTLLDVRTRKETRLLPKRAENWQHSPSWSAAGDKLAFLYNRHPLPPVVAPQEVWDAWQAKQAIYIINRDGTGLKELIGEEGPHARYPKLSPDGSELLWTQEINGRLQIFKLDMNSGIRTQLTHIGDLFQANIGGDWFDPAYALPVPPQPELLTTTWGELKKE